MSNAREGSGEWVMREFARMPLIQVEFAPPFMVPMLPVVDVDRDATSPAVL
jgi:hypothetical protein